MSAMNSTDNQAFSTLETPEWDQMDWTVITSEDAPISEVSAFTGVFVEKTAPFYDYSTPHSILGWWLQDGDSDTQLLSDDELESMWFKITGHPFAMYLKFPGLFELIMDLQYREFQILRLYNAGHWAPRTTMMQFHDQFYADSERRISDFMNNQSFKRFIDGLIAEKLV